MKLALEIRGQKDKTVVLGDSERAVIMTPPIDEDYWQFRVRVSETQSVVGFPKFTTIGIGFAQEEDWNTNLPYTCSTEMIWNHIKHNKGDDGIADEYCIAAIEMIREAAAKARDQK